MLEVFPFLRDFAMILISAALLGWGATRLGLPAVVGYLVAGVLIGTPEITFAYVQDSDRMQLLSQLGLLFLMFSIGLDLRIERLRALGWPIIMAVTITALLVINVVQGFGSLLGLNANESIFFAGMFVSSSSAIIGKALESSPQRHHRSGQLALAFTLLEDLAAVIMLTLLSTRGESTGGGFSQILETLGAAGIFFLVVGILGLVLLPRLLKVVHRGGARELETLTVAGLLFALASLAMWLGFSLAMGAFLFGVIVAETDRRSYLERVFRGMRDVFLAVFFAATGMLLDWREISEAWPLIVGGVALALLVRPLAATVALLGACEEGKTAFRTGLSVVSIGEFAIVISGLGVAMGLLGGSYSVAAVVMTVVTGGLAPLIMDRSGKIADFAARVIPSRVDRWMGAYRGFWAELGERSERNQLWRLIRKRLVQMVVELILVFVVLAMGQTLAQWSTENIAGPDWAVQMGSWIVIGLICLPLLIAIMRNVDVVIMILSDAWTQSSKFPSAGVVPFGIIARTFMYAGLAVWIGSFLSVGGFGGWSLLFLLAILILVGWVAWRRLNRWHSDWESEVQQALAGERGLPASLAEPTSAWGLTLGEVELPEGTALAGRSLGAIGLRAAAGVTLVAIERQGFLIAGPDARTALYAGDRVLLLGEPEQVEAGRRVLVESVAVGPDERRDESVRDALTRSWRVQEGSPAIGKTLTELGWPRRFGVLVAAVRRRRVVTRNPGAHTQLETGDELLLVGSPSDLRAWSRSLENDPEEADAAGASPTDRGGSN